MNSTSNDVETDDNMIRIAYGIYLVKTQAGFRKALKTQFSGDYGDWRWMAANKLYGHPTKYPAVVSLSVGYDGGHCFICNKVSVAALKLVLSKLP